MGPASLLLNVLWIVFGGLWMAAGWLIAAVIMAITIIGIPWTRAALTSRFIPCCPSARPWCREVTRLRGIGSARSG